MYWLPRAHCHWRTATGTGTTLRVGPAQFRGRSWCAPPRIYSVTWSRRVRARMPLKALKGLASSASSTPDSATTSSTQPNARGPARVSALASDRPVRGGTCPALRSGALAVCTLRGRFARQSARGPGRWRTPAVGKHRAYIHTLKLTLPERLRLRLGDS